MKVIICFVLFCIAPALTQHYGKSCYQCAYSPPKTYYDQRVVVDYHNYGHRQEYNDGYHGNERGVHGGYRRERYIPIEKQIRGGWERCLARVDAYRAKQFGIDVWDCHSNCYTRKDINGDVYRGCYKGEFGVNPHRLGCQQQQGATWCFCDGDRCNTMDGRYIETPYNEYRGPLYRK